MPAAERPGRVIHGVAMPRSPLIVFAVVLPAIAHAQVSDPVVVTGLPYMELPAISVLSQAAVQAPLLRGGARFSELPSAHDEDLALRSAAAVVIDLEEGKLLYAKNTEAVMPI